MRYLLLVIAMCSGISIAYAYEQPSFERSRFRDDFGIFRYIDGCWYRVTSENLDIADPIVCGDIDSLSSALDGRNNNNGGTNSGSFGGGGSTSGDGGAGTGNGENGGSGGFFGGNGGGASDSGDDDETGTGSGGQVGGDNGRSGTGCSSIYDSIDGGSLGPIPCTTYLGVFGPVPRLPRASDR